MKVGNRCPLERVGRGFCRVASRFAGAVGIGRWWKSYLGITLGTAVTALGINAFYVPNRLNDGGVTGVAILLHLVWGVPLGVGIFGLNVPLFLAGARVLGGGFGARTLFGIAALSLWSQVLRPPPATHDLLLGAVYGGVLSGLGLGIVFRSQGTTGGTDLVARLLVRYAPLTMGQGLLAADLVVIAATSLVFGLTLGMYSLFALFVATRMVDAVQWGLDYSKAAWIITERGGTVAKEIMDALGRGATVFQARGAYTGRDKDAVLVVISRSEVFALKAVTYRADPQAFLVFGEAHEVYGEGFRQVEHLEKRHG